jgi:CBS domain-containing protein
MKVRELMTGTPCYCGPQANLGTATELMWRANCGFLPVLSAEGKLIGVITDRDICIALGTRNCLASQLNVAELMSGKLHSCGPEDDIHSALQTMGEAKVRRLPVRAQNGTLAGVLSLHDILLRAEPVGYGKTPELSRDEVMRTLRSILRERVLATHA